MPDIERALIILQNGGVIAYPTEAVYGLGCDPRNAEAVNTLLSLKNRLVDKGLILIAANTAQLSDYIAQDTFHLQPQIQQQWPGPITWVLPCKPQTPAYLSGGRQTLAVRVTAHPIARQLCEQFQYPIVSTSANLSGQPPFTCAGDIATHFNEQIDYIVNGPVGDATNVTPIYEASSGRQLR